MTPKVLKRPSSILYGLYGLHQSLCFMDEAYIRAYSAEVEQVKSCSTVAEALALAPTLRLAWVPGVPENEDELEDYELSLEDSYDWTMSGPAADGDWPPMPTGFSLEVFEDLAVSTRSGPTMTA